MALLKTKPKGHWSCKQHGDTCQSYVQADIDFKNPNSFNAKGITPNDVKKMPKDKQVYVDKCLMWVEE